MKQFAFFMIMLFCFGCLAFAQTESEAEQNPEVEIIEEPIEVVEDPITVNQFGDNSIQIGGMAIIPFKPEISQLFVGGSGALSYNFHFSKWFSLGGTLGFCSSATIGGNVFYYLPFMLRPTAHFYIWRFEIPVSVGLGGAFQAYADRSYFGFVVKPELGFFYRINPSWSAGINTGLFILPQRYEEDRYNYTGVIMDVGLSARYHF